MATLNDIRSAFYNMSRHGTIRITDNAVGLLHSAINSHRDAVVRYALETYGFMPEEADAALYDFVQRILYLAILKALESGRELVTVEDVDNVLRSPEFFLLFFARRSMNRPI
jgi:hypothetical protein